MIADGANIYNPSRVFLGSHAIVSQEAYLCGATHDYNSANFPLVSFPIIIGAYAWICARATVQPNIVVAAGTVVALGAVLTKSTESWMVYAGVPAQKIKPRNRFMEESAQ